jgi:hypothetical protein
MPLFLFIFSYFITYIHSFNHNIFIHRHSLRPLQFFIACLLSGKDLPVVPSRESNSGLPYSKPTLDERKMEYNFLVNMKWGEKKEARKRKRKRRGKRKKRDRRKTARKRKGKENREGEIEKWRNKGEQSEEMDKSRENQEKIEAQHGKLTARKQEGGRKGMEGERCRERKK